MCVPSCDGDATYMPHFHKENHKQPCWMQNYGEQSPLMRLCFFRFFVKRSQQIFLFMGMKERDEEDADFQILQMLTEIADQWQVIYLLSLRCEITVLISHHCGKISYYVFRWFKCRNKLPVEVWKSLSPWYENPLIQWRWDAVGRDEFQKTFSWK